MDLDIHRMLGVRENVPIEVVKRAYRGFCKRNHPDLYQGDRMREERFKEVSSAYRRWTLIEHVKGEIRRIRENSPLFRELEV
jgi:DnaJ-class molecular chaperone